MLLITGAAGFIGGNFVHHWFSHTDEPVVVLDKLTYAGNPDTISAHLQSGLATLARGDICDPETVVRACEGKTSVFHNASLVHTRHSRVEQVRAVNIDGARNVLAGCRKHAVPRLVYVSSASVVYEGNDIEHGDENLPYARSFLAPYAETKRTAG